MAPSVPLPPPGFDQLSVDEQIDYVQSLWDRIADNSGKVSAPDWHREILDQRVRESNATDTGESWDIVRDRLRRKLRRTRRNK